MKALLTIFLFTIIFSCTKDKDENCYWTDNSGTDWDHYPSPAEKQAFELQCSCTMVLTKHCN